MNEGQRSDLDIIARVPKDAICLTFWGRVTNEPYKFY